MKKNFFDVSIIILTYNPQADKLYKTLMSAILQDNVSFQIIISDDGSETNLFDEVVDFFKANHFENYKLINNKVNVGTVKNVLGAVKRSDGQYIKLISPGDLLYSENTLSKWLKEMKKNNSDWSFGDAVYYKKNNGIELINNIKHPVVTDVYLNNNIDRCRWNYLVNNDICLGASTLCKKEALLKYLKIIENKVVYAEDNAYRIMMYDNVSFTYAPFDVIFYEYGSGVSTSGNNKWYKKIETDWNNTSDIISKLYSTPDKFQQRILLAVNKKKIFLWNKLMFKIKKKIIKHKVSNSIIETDMLNILYKENFKCK